MRFSVTIRPLPTAWAESLRPQLLRIVNRLGKAGNFTLVDMADAAMSQRRHDLGAFLERLVSGNQLRRDDGHYVLDRPIEIAAESAVARKQQQMWNILRGSQGRPSLDVETLALLATTSQVVVSKGDASRYVKALFDGHYLKDRAGGRFVLPADRNVGPHAPRLMEVRFLVDPNNCSIGRNLVAEEAKL